MTTLTLPNLYKDDEGLYTLRMVTKGGTAEHSAFVSVSGEMEMEGLRKMRKCKESWSGLGHLCLI